MKYFLRLAAIGFTYSVVSELDHRATAIRGAAVALELFLGCFRDRLIEFHVVIVEEFLAWVDVAHGVNEDAIVFFNRLTVWIARMIDPPRVVTANFGIDYLAVFESEIESVWIIMVVRGGFP